MFYYGVDNVMFESKKMKKDGYKSDLNTEHSKQSKTYIGEHGPKVPDYFKYDKSRERGNMESVKPNAHSEKEKSPDKTGQLNSPLGKLEAGYDPHKKDAVLSLKDWSMNKPKTTVAEDKAEKKEVDSKEKFRSNDKKMLDSAIDLRYDPKTPRQKIKDDIKDLSEEKNRRTMFNRVIPFNDTNVEKEKIQELKRIRSQAGADKKAIDKQISEINKIKEEKDKKNLEFEQKLQKAMADIQTRSTMSFDEYIIYIKKRMLEIEEAEGEDDNNNNKDENNQNEQTEKAPEVVQQETEQQGQEQDGQKTQETGENTQA